MLLQGIKPSVPKTKPSLRDIIMKEMEEKLPSTELKESVPQPGFWMRMYLGSQRFLSWLPFFRR